MASRGLYAKNAQTITGIVHILSLAELFVLHPSSRSSGSSVSTASPFPVSQWIIGDGSAITAAGPRGIFTRLPF